MNKKIASPDSGRAPLLLERKKAVEGTTRINNADGKVVFKKVPKRVMEVLSNLPLVIGEMFAAAGLMALGTIIDQGEVPEFSLGLDHMFSSPIFLGSLAILGASLMACTNTTQIPLLKVARQPFLNSAEPVHKQKMQTLSLEHRLKTPLSHRWKLDMRSVEAGDLQSTILNDKTGKFTVVREPNSKLQIEIDGTKIVTVDAIGSTSLDLKVKFCPIVNNCDLLNSRNFD